MQQIMAGAGPDQEPGVVRMTSAGGSCHAVPMTATDRGTGIDELDARLLRELVAAPRVGVLELSRRLGVARATVQARLDRLVRRGVIGTFAPTLDPEALGFTVTAFATLEIRQGRGAQVLDHLRSIPEVLEVHTITGQGDMLCRVVARSNDDLQDVLNRLNEFDGIVRTSTVIALSNPIAHRVLPLVKPEPDGGR
jgi:DNA-binding Lrp family transcriptional regulator